ncbi:hypothetical protein CBR_g22979 [Chara braunii]|uniref:HORMA domain-containing protein n=1 Tax=Chara braunii TaxID=69332 RepID=A0A388L3I2_CHABU|nr:hypothetical protein CBR_g22979 [Chara braunii]|eukprot:GBG76763.1 hypothetical protein CBR_g22979 [Chara braunii]
MDASQQQLVRGTITLKGSAAIVSDFFFHAVNSILYQRGIYPSDSFTQVKKYGLPILVCENDGVKKYLNQVLEQVSDWLSTGNLKQLVMVIASLSSSDPIERWVFNIETDKAVVESGVTREKPEKEIMGEIQAIIRQITASITFLPLLEERCSFDLLAYTTADAKVPEAWDASDERLLKNAQSVRLRSFSTKVHQVDTMVAYRHCDDDEDED